LMIGGDLTAADPWTISLLTNPEVLVVDQHSRGNHPAVATETIVIWVAESTEKESYYVAAFNRGEVPAEVHYSWRELGLKGSKHAIRNLWERKDMGTADGLGATIPAHGCLLYELKPAAQRNE
jgi:alpha-galactosidase